MSESPPQQLAVVTGGAGILGSCMAKGLGKAGAEVAICDIVSTEALIKDLKKEGIRAHGYYLDVMNQEKTKTCYDEVINDLGEIHI